MCLVCYIYYLALFSLMFIKSFCPENMLVDGDMNFNGMLNASGGPEFSEPKQNGNTNFRPDHTIPPPRMGLLGGGEGTTSGGWVNNSTTGNNGSGWGSNARTSTNSSVSELSCSSNSGNTSLQTLLF